MHEILSHPRLFNPGMGSVDLIEGLRITLFTLGGGIIGFGIAGGINKLLGEKINLGPLPHLIFTPAGMGILFRLTYLEAIKD